MSEDVNREAFAADPLQSMRHRLQRMEERVSRTEGRIDWLEEQAPGVDCPCTHCAHLRANTKPTEESA